MVKPKNALLFGGDLLYLTRKTSTGVSIKISEKTKKYNIESFLFFSLIKIG